MKRSLFPFLLCTPVSVALRSATSPQGRPLRAPSAPVLSVSAVLNEEKTILELLEGSTRGKGLSTADKAEVFRLASILEERGASSDDTNASPLLPGRWRVLFQGKPGEDVEFFSVQSWRSYLSGTGPSPIQNLVSSSGSVSRLYQVVEVRWRASLPISALCLDCPCLWPVPSRSQIPSVPSSLAVAARRFLAKDKQRRRPLASRRHRHRGGARRQAAGESAWLPLHRRPSAAARPLARYTLAAIPRSVRPTR